jgi:hypothetical protein
MTEQKVDSIILMRRNLKRQYPAEYARRVAEFETKHGYPVPYELQYPERVNHVEGTPPRPILTKKPTPKKPETLLSKIVNSRVGERALAVLTVLLLVGAAVALCAIMTVFMPFTNSFSGEKFPPDNT